MDRFLIESPHDAEDCKKVVKSVYALGYLYNCDWGCQGGVHTAWVTIEAENESQALLVVPPVLRAKARATKLAKFDPEIVKDWKE
jgi:hypothetical protein